MRRYYRVDFFDIAPLNHIGSNLFDCQQTNKCKVEKTHHNDIDGDICMEKTHRDALFSHCADKRTSLQN